MWSKISNSFKPRHDAEASTIVRPETPQLDSQLPPVGSVMAKVLEQHPNLSVFYNDYDPLDRAPSPSSPSKRARLNPFKRASKVPKPEHEESSNDNKLSIPFVNKVKSSLHIHTSVSNASLPLPSSNTSRYSLEIPRSSVDTVGQPHTPREYGSVRSIMRDQNTPRTGQSVRFFSRDAYRVITPDPSSSSGEVEPTFMQKLQADQEQHAGAREAQESQYLSAMQSPGEMFSPISLSPLPSVSTPSGLPKSMINYSMTSLMVPIPPPDLTDLFNLSREEDAKEIPLVTGATLQDNAVEVTDLEDTVADQVHQPPYQSQPRLSSDDIVHIPLSPLDAESARIEAVGERSKSLGRKAGEAVFQSLTNLAGNANSMRSSSALGLHKLFGNGNTQNQSHDTASFDSSSSQNRSINESVLARQRTVTPVVDLVQSTMRSLEPTTTQTVGFLPAPEGLKAPETPDPFRMDATTYFTPETRIPNSPPRMGHVKNSSTASARTHSSVTHSYISREDRDSIVVALRTQLALQQELSTQYEIDLSARDDLVQALQGKIEQSERDWEKRRAVLRSWKKKVAELERVCQGLEDEIDRSKQESFERSVMDEASSEALRHLHVQIKALEREKSDVGRREGILKGQQEVLERTIKEKEETIETLREELARMREVEKKEAKDVNTSTVSLVSRSSKETSKDWKNAVLKLETAISQEQQNRREASFTWAEERARISTELKELQGQRAEIDGAVENLYQQLDAKNVEVETLKKEAEETRRRMQEASEEMNQVKEERDSLRVNIEEIERRMTEMELEWTESENRKAELEKELEEVWTSHEEIQKERESLHQEIDAQQEKVHQLEHEIESLEHRNYTLQEENRFAADNVARLEDMLQQRDGELGGRSQKIADKEQECESLQTELAKMRKEFERLVSDKGRGLEDALAREAEATQNAERLLQEKAASEVQFSLLKEQVKTLEGQSDSMRRRVHELQQESADKEVKIVQLTKQREQDADDKAGLNIALDSKQQELELLKRKLGVRGTAGSTPGPASRSGNRRESFVTPIPMRPPSTMSDAEIDQLRHSQNETPGLASATRVRPVAIQTLGRSARMNSRLSETPSAAPKIARLSEISMGPPPPRPRASMSGLGSGASTPAVKRTPSALGKSSSINGVTPNTVKPQKRASSSTLSKSVLQSSGLRSGNTSDASSAVEDKENVKPSRIPASSSRRSSMVLSS